MAGIKICAICGKEFEAKGRERTCPGPHYLPCPVCGKPVVIKYISDGARNCEECKGKHASKKIVPASEAKEIALEDVAKPAVAEITDTVSEVEQSEEAQSLHSNFELPKESDNPTITIELQDDESIKTYVGPLINSKLFIPNHKYKIELSKEQKYGCYVITSGYDYTDDEKVDIYLRVSSMNTVNRYFK